MKQPPKPKVTVKATKVIIKPKMVAKATLDSIDIAKQKSGKYAKQDFARKDFVEKESSLSDSVKKYRDKVINSARKMTPSELSKKNISKNITSKKDTVYKYSSGGIDFTEKRPKK